MAQYGLLGEGAGVKRVLDQHNATFQIVERLARDEKSLLRRRFLVREAGAFVRYETAVCQRYDHVTFVTEEDRQALVGRMSDRSLLRRSTVIPICIDTESVAPVLPGSTPFRVTHIGTMYWPPNVEGILWFWEEIWPRVQVQVPEACLTLIGKNPGPRIQALGDGPNVEVVGYVEDVAPYLSETAVFIVPLRAAGGMRVKILDAWCWGLPIVSTMIGAEGITIREGENILIADAPEVFSEAVVQLLRDADNARQLRTNGRRWVEDRYDWRRVYRAWDTVYDQLLQAS
jgi:glycosyltransferase involved in cell wall biosynthesis